MGRVGLALILTLALVSAIGIASYGAAAPTIYFKGMYVQVPNSTGGTTTGVDGTDLTWIGGNGSAGSTTGGAGSDYSWLGGTGETTATGTGGRGGNVTITAGTGGSASGAGTGGAGGNLLIYSGAGGATSGGAAGASGTVTCKVGGASGTTFLAVDTAGASTLPYWATVAETTNARACTSADYGKTILLSYAGAVAITLPANGSPGGAWIRFINIGSDSTVPTIAAATNDTLIAPNDAAADSVTFATGHRIGSCVLAISTGTYWVVMNQSTGCTMTVNT